MDCEAVPSHHSTLTTFSGGTTNWKTLIETEYVYKILICKISITFSQFHFKNEWQAYL